MSAFRELTLQCDSTNTVARYKIQRCFPEIRVVASQARETVKGIPANELRPRSFAQRACNIQTGFLFRNIQYLPIMYKSVDRSCVDADIQLHNHANPITPIYHKENKFVKKSLPRKRKRENEVYVLIPGSICLTTLRSFRIPQERRNRRTSLFFFRTLFDRNSNFLLCHLMEIYFCLFFFFAYSDYQIEIISFC